MGVDCAAVVAVSQSLGVYIMQCRVSPAAGYGFVADVAECVDVDDVIEPWVEPEAVWSLFSTSSPADASTAPLCAASR